ncbi:MAG: signal transduction protein, partial [Herminiimonas sp.]|nr:signal transduction protein [Herminiimonas sp.]
RQEWLQQVAAFSTTAAALIPKMTQPGEDVASRALLSRFGTALNLDGPRLAELMATVARETSALHDNADLRFGAEGLEAEHGPADVSDDDVPDETGLLSGLLLQGADAGGGAIDRDVRHPSGKPLQARELLQAGVQDVNQMMASGRLRVNDLILLALETLYRSMGFRFATICLRDVATDQYRARIALGEDHARLQKGFVFPAVGKRDLFTLAMSNDADLLIADASEPKIAALVPAWHHALMPDVRSFIVVPLVVQKVPFGFFYADRTCTAPEGVPSDETALIKTLKGQVLAALGAR